MATLHKYFKPVNSSSNLIGPSSLPSSTISQVVKEVKKATESKKRGEYMRISQEDKAAIGKYASEHGVSKAVKHYREKNVKESSVRDWRRAYEKELKEKSKTAIPGQVMVVNALPAKTRGRPPLLGNKLDKHLQELIISMRSRGTPIGSSVVIAIGRGILLKHDKRSLEEFGGHIKLGKEWAKSVLRRMGYTKRRANSKSKVLPNDFIRMKEDYLMDIKAVVEMEEIPHDMIINWDQTAMKIVPSCLWTMEKRGTKRVEITGIDDKRQITAVFACTLSGKVPPNPAHLSRNYTKMPSQRCYVSFRLAHLLYCQPLVK